MPIDASPLGKKIAEYSYAPLKGGQKFGATDL